jgi:hypothetical protein
MGNKNNFKLVLERLANVQELINVEIERETLSAIERDILLEKLRSTYELVLFGQAESPKPIVAEKFSGKHSDTQPEMRRKETPPNVSELSQAKEVEVDDRNTESVSEDIQNIEEQSVDQQNQVEMTDVDMDFALDEEPKGAEKGEPEVDAGYSEAEISEMYSESEESAVDIDTESNGKRETSTPILAEKFQGKKKFRNEVLGSGKKDIASHLKNKPISDLTKAIGINDKFLFTKELFNGNAELYARSIKQLNSFDDINDALIYIQENFSWDENNEAANQLIDLVRRKLLYD